jgi:RNA polymerase sigma factor (sigma-70 family)
VNENEPRYGLTQKNKCLNLPRAAINNQMPDASEMDLLHDYCRLGSEEAFTAVVQKHVNLVYSVALRHVGVAAQAEEITQAVFVILARKAAGLRPDTILEAWLYETTRLTSLSFSRSERRRQLREQEAYMLSKLQEPSSDALWNQLAPLLDEEISRLGKKDRDAVMLRFFMEKSIPEVAAALKVTEAAAQRRVLRAVEKLRASFARRGVVVSAAALTGAISAKAVQAAPATLAKTAAAAAIGKGITATGPTLTLIKATLKVMAWTKAKTAVAVGTMVLLVVSSTVVVINKLSPNAAARKMAAVSLNSYEGRFEMPGHTLVLQRRGAGLAAVDVDGRAGFIAYPASDTKFISHEQNSLTELTFLRDASGRVTEVTLIRDGRKLGDLKRSDTQ